MSDAFVAHVTDEDNHVALKVKDLDASLRFYHDVMGLPILRTFGGPDNPRVFVPGIQLILQNGESGPNPYGIFDHLGIGITNIKEVCARLDQAGYTCETPLQKRTPPGSDQSLMLAFYLDPDGNRVELVHWI